MIKTQLPTKKNAILNEIQASVSYHQSSSIIQTVYLYKSSLFNSVTALVPHLLSPLVLCITSPKCQCDAKYYNLFDFCCFSFVIY